MSDTIGRRSDTVRQVELDDELTLFDTASGSALALNRTAREIWLRADGRSTLDDVVSALAAQHETTPEAIREDVLTALAAMEDAGVLVHDR